MLSPYCHDIGPIFPSTALALGSLRSVTEVIIDLINLACGLHWGNKDRSQDEVHAPLERDQYFLTRTEQSTILDKSLGTLAHFCSICQGNLSVRPLPPSSMLFIVMNSSLLVSNIVGGKGVPYSSDAISYFFQNSLSTHVPVI